MKRLHYWLWGIAERADWDTWPPRGFWRWLIQYEDRKHGWHHPAAMYED